MELRRREHERQPPQAGARRVDPCQKQEVPEQSAAPLEALAAVKEEMTGGDLRLAVVDGDASMDSDSDSDSDSDRDYESDEELLGLGKSSSMRKGSNQEKLTGKKRTADMIKEDSRVEAGEGAEEIVDGQKESGNKKLSSSDFNVSSQPNKICEAVAMLNEPQREKLKELGFGSLLDFKMDKCGPVNLIFWLMDHLDQDDQDPDTMVLHFGGNRKLSITQHTVNCVMGLQMGGSDPPLMLTNTRKLNGLPLLRKKLGVPTGKCIKVGDLLKKIQSGGTDSKYITESAWNMVNQDFDKFGHMNWCKFIVDQLKYSAKMWKEQGGKYKIVYGCSAVLVMYYLDNLDCSQKMRSVEVPRAKFFGKEMIQKLVKADMQKKDGLTTFGNLNLRNQRGTCYDERAESSRHVTTTVCNSSDIAMATQGTTPSLEASDEFHGDPKGTAVPQGEHVVNGGSEDSYRHMLVNSVQGAGEDVLQLASTSMKEQVNDFMGSSMEPEILQKLDSLLPQIRASVALGVRTLDLEQQVQELTKKLRNKEEELEATREMLRGAQATIANNQEVLEGTRAKLRTAQVFQLEAQSAVAAINCLALRLSATFVRLGSDPPSPSGVVSSSSSLEEAVKLLEDLVSRVEPVSRSHAMSLARSSVGFGAAALLSRDREKGVKALHDPVSADTRRFVQSQGPEFHSLVAQVVDAVQKHQHGNDAANTRS